MPRRRPRRVPLTEPVRSCEKWTTNVIWPAPIDQRLKQLVEQAIDAGEPELLSRSELLAALVLTAPNDAAALRAILERYRQARVRDCRVGKTAVTGNVIVLAERRPGRPKRG